MSLFHVLTYHLLSASLSLDLNALLVVVQAYLQTAAP